MDGSHRSPHGRACASPPHCPSHDCACVSLPQVPSLPPGQPGLASRGGPGVSVGVVHSYPGDLLLCQSGPVPRGTQAQVRPDAWGDLGGGLHQFTPSVPCLETFPSTSKAELAPTEVLLTSGRSSSKDKTCLLGGGDDTCPRAICQAPSRSSLPSNPTRRRLPPIKEEPCGDGAVSTIMGPPVVNTSICLTGAAEHYPRDGRISRRQTISAEPRVCGGTCTVRACCTLSLSGVVRLTLRVHMAVRSEPSGDGQGFALPLASDGIRSSAGVRDLPRPGATDTSSVRSLVEGASDGCVEAREDALTLATRLPSALGAGTSGGCDGSSGDEEEARVGGGGRTVHTTSLVREDGRSAWNSVAPRHGPRRAR